jgi:hypothetical protein
VEEVGEDLQAGQPNEDDTQIEDGPTEPASSPTETEDGEEEGEEGIAQPKPVVESNDVEQQDESFDEGEEIEEEEESVNNDATEEPTDNSDDPDDFPVGEVEWTDMAGNLDEEESADPEEEGIEDWQENEWKDEEDYEPVETQDKYSSINDEPYESPYSQESTGISAGRNDDWYDDDGGLSIGFVLVLALGVAGLSCFLKKQRSSSSNDFRNSGYQPIPGSKTRTM